MTKRLETIRDELAGIFMIDPTVDGGVSVECFKAGFNAAARELWSEVVMMVDALEYYAHNVTFDTYEEKSRAIDALTAFRKATGDE